MPYRLPIAALILGLAACSPDYQPDVPNGTQAATQSSGKVATAIFAGGCFWCTESDFEKVPGVIAAVSGYTGGTTDSPTYEQVSAEGTGHFEAVQVRYDPARVSYAALVDYYFRTVDPTDAGGQFCDRGASYRTAIFVGNAQERAAAEKEKAEVDAVLDAVVVTPILPAAQFWDAEGYHQDYYKANSLKYNFYRSRCGRDARLAQLWGEKPS
ncbi:MAG: peptide-methionine (S)-S-oxide reductase MsrA [Pseudomonadota bacterium]|nr:peptide-methionine (S)-S-oxide reductase MsrA [Pseudomonadota bacterium]